MGRRIVCPKCNTVFDEDVLKAKNSENTCLVCDADLRGDDTSSSDIQASPLSFGDDVELSENDSFDEDKIDFWWYSIDEPGALGEASRGLLYSTCAKCGTHTSFSYPIAKTKDYMLLDKRINRKCNKCGNELKNHILSKRPADYVDPRQREMWARDYVNMPKCPICSSTKIHKISATNKVASALTFGIFAAGHVSKTYKCDICGAKF